MEAVGELRNSNMNHKKTDLFNEYTISQQFIREPNLVEHVVYSSKIDSVGIELLKRMILSSKMSYQ